MPVSSRRNVFVQVSTTTIKSLKDVTGMCKHSSVFFTVISDTCAWWNGKNNITSRGRYDIDLTYQIDACQQLKPDPSCIHTRNRGQLSIAGADLTVIVEG